MSKKKTTGIPQPSQLAAPAKASWHQRPSWLAGLLFAFSFLLYANTLGHDFALDDAIVITDNFIVQKGISGWAELFSYDTFYGFFKDESKAQLVSGGRYRPFSLALFSLERSISKGPFIHHLFNLLWYGACVLLLFALLRRIAKQYAGSDSDLAIWLPFLAALFFAAHPLHTEVVANIKGRDEILALSGSLAATWLVWQAAEKQQWAAALWAALVFFLALLSKENSITFMAVIPLSLLLFRRASGWQQWRYLLPLLASTAIFLLIRQSVIGSPAAALSPELMNNPFLKWTGQQWVAFSFAEWSATVVYSLGEYLRLLLFPLRLSHDYYPRALEIMSWSQVIVWLAALANLGLLLLGLLLWRRRPWVSFSLVGYFATLSIVSNVFFPVGTLLSERFLFMPSLFFALLLAYVALLVATRFSSHDFMAIGLGGGAGGQECRSKADEKSRVSQPSALASSAPRLLPTWLWLGVGLLLSLYSFRTLSRNPVWKDNYSLFTQDVLVQPKSAKLQNAAAGAKIDHYQHLPPSSQPSQQHLLSEALDHASQALNIHPTYKSAFLLRGNAKVLLEQYEAAIADYDAALVLDPNYREAQLNQAIALQQLGRFYGEQKGDLASAKTYLERAYALQPQDFETLRLLGVLNGNLGQISAAINYFTQALALDPENADLCWTLGLVHTQTGQSELAQQYFQKAETLEPGIAQRKN